MDEKSPFFLRTAPPFLAALLLFMPFFPISKAYFSPVLVLFGLFFMGASLHFHRAGEPVLPSLSREATLAAAAILLFYGVLLAGALLSGDGRNVSVARDMIEYSLPFFLGLYLFARFDTGKGAEWGLAAAGAAVVFGAVWVESAHEGRWEGFFVHPTQLGTAIALLWPPLLAMGARDKRRLVRAGIVLLLAALLFCLYKSESRGPVAALAGGLFLGGGGVLWLHRRDLSAGIKKAALWALAVLLILGVTLFGAIQGQKGIESKTGGERILMAEATWHMWEDHQLEGIGLANWEDMYYSPQYHPEAGREKGLGKPHNMPLYFLAAAGTPGGLAWLAYSVLTFLALWRTAKRGDPWLSAAMLAVFWAFTIEGMVDSTFTQRFLARIYFALLGYTLAIAGRDNHTGKEVSRTEEASSSAPEEANIH